MTRLDFKGKKLTVVAVEDDESVSVRPEILSIQSNVKCCFDTVIDTML